MGLAANSCQIWGAKSASDAASDKSGVGQLAGKVFGAAFSPGGKTFGFRD